MMYQACHAGIMIMIYFSDQMKMNRDADPKNEIIKDIKILITMPVNSSFLRCVLRFGSVSCIYPFRISLFHRVMRV